MFKLFVQLERKFRSLLRGPLLLIINFCQRHEEALLRVLDPLSIAVLLQVVAFFSVYELWYVLPEVLDPGSLGYVLSWLLGIFLIHNILGNMVACWRTDTSPNGLSPKRLEPLPSEEQLWHLCVHCRIQMPPRAWHCKRCKRCVLKRDHHCVFTGSCIGHANQRYFIGMLTHLTLAGFTCLLYNVLHFWPRRALLLQDPLLLIGHMFNYSPPNLDQERIWLIFNFGILKLNTIALAAPTIMLIVQLWNTWRGSCMYKSGDRSFDIGAWRNFELVLGRRMFWALLTPLLPSPLPHDGTRWQKAEQSCA